MIEECAINEVSDNLTEENVIRFFKDQQDNIVYFYHLSDLPSLSVDRLHTFKPGELVLPTRAKGKGTFVVLYSNRELAISLLESNFKVGKVRLKQFVSIANSASPADGIFVQGNSCWFTIGLKTLNAGLKQNA
ncbi:hypothetical protein P886_0191 [Alteromonadaceae bacterium 2753L.S.0a.02]|nr:hypothetical protein P886_0191 [Alteromonadaceae bacterium 2753L.S.0a.02]